MPSTSYDTLAETTRVWIYQSQRPFSAQEEEAIEQQVQAFTQQWTSHNQQLQTHALIKHRQFIILMVDESRAGASGCSIDKSVHFMQGLEQQFGINLFDRMSFTFEQNGTVQTASKEELTRMYKEGMVDDDTFVFNNLVNNKADFEQNWRIPLGKSWHKRLLK